MFSGISNQGDRVWLQNHLVEYLVNYGDDYVDLLIYKSIEARINKISSISAWRVKGVIRLLSSHPSIIMCAKLHRDQLNTAWTKAPGARGIMRRKIVSVERLDFESLLDKLSIFDVISQLDALDCFPPYTQEHLETIRLMNY